MALRGATSEGLERRKLPGEGGAGGGGELGMRNKSLCSRQSKGIYNGIKTNACVHRVSTVCWPAGQQDDMAVAGEAA
jgi:hypothetical protein